MEILATIGSCFQHITLSHGLVLSLFAGGLLGSLTHCVGMCGPFVLSQIKNVHKMQSALLIPYHLGRITTYTLLALLFHSVLNLSFLFLPQRAVIIVPLLALAAIIFLVNAFPRMAIFFPWVKLLRIPLPQKILTTAMDQLRKFPKPLQPFGMGLLLGFMPCGLVIAALMATTTAETAPMAMAGMIAFGLGTMPALISLSLGGYAVKGKHPVLAQRLSKGFAVWSSIWLFALAGILLIQ